MSGIVKAPVNPIHPEKAPSPIFVTVLGIGRLATVRDVQPLNMSRPILVNWLERLTVPNAVHPENNPSPIWVTLLGIVKLVRPEPSKTLGPNVANTVVFERSRPVRLVQLRKASLKMLVREDPFAVVPIITLESFEHPSNADTEIEATESGIIIFVKSVLEQPLNALIPIWIMFEGRFMGLSFVLFKLTHPLNVPLGRLGTAIFDREVGKVTVISPVQPEKIDSPRFASGTAIDTSALHPSKA